MPRHLSHIAVGVIYHPPDADSRKMSSHIVSCVDNILQQHPHAGVIILGDCNTLNDKTILDYPLKQVVYSPTRGNALLDKIYTNMSDWYLKTTVLPNIGTLVKVTIEQYSCNLQDKIKNETTII